MKQVKAGEARERSTRHLMMRPAALLSLLALVGCSRAKDKENAGRAAGDASPRTEQVGRATPPVPASAEREAELGEALAQASFADMAIRDGNVYWVTSEDSGVHAATPGKPARLLWSALG